MYRKFEVRPVVISENGEVTPFLTHSVAADYSAESEGVVAFGFYGLGENGLWERISDTTSKEGMIELIWNLLAVDLQWKNMDRLEFSRKPEGQVVVFASEGITRSVAIRDLPEGNVPCIVVDYDDRHDDAGSLSPEDFERKMLGVSREQFDKTATYVW